MNPLVTTLVLVATTLSATAVLALIRAEPKGSAHVVCGPLFVRSDHPNATMTAEFRRDSHSPFFSLVTMAKRPSLPATRHADGSICPEGTARVPRGKKLCCEEFKARTLACFFDIRYEWWSEYRGWFTVVSPSAGGGGIAMNYCPHCGHRLPGRKRSGRFLEA